MFTFVCIFDFGNKDNNLFLNKRVGSQTPESAIFLENRKIRESGPIKRAGVFYKNRKIRELYEISKSVWISRTGKTNTSTRLFGTPE